MRLPRIATLVATAAMSLTMAPAVAAPAVTSAPATTAASTSNANIVLPGLKGHVAPSCTGASTDSNRVQVMYAREQSGTDHYSADVSLIQNQAKYIDDVFALSSKQTGGGRRVRWVFNSDCTVSVKNVVVPDGALTGGDATTLNALNSQGLLSTGHKYLIFGDVSTVKSADAGSTCGYGDAYTDSSASGNANDGTHPQIAFVANTCWTPNSPSAFSPALHELTHAMGAVQPDAPHAFNGEHCYDGPDAMCQSDGVHSQTYCPASQQPLLDCNHDDYFSTAPAAGSYLATHWNMAKSPFLDTVTALPDPPALSISADNTTPAAQDKVTFTANVASGTTVQWSSDVPQCVPAGESTTGTTFTIQCLNADQPTVTAVASNSGITTNTVSQSVSYSPGTAPSLSVNAPSSAQPGQAFDLTASMANSQTSWTYKWALNNSGCSTTSALTSATIHVTCDDTMSGQVAGFTVAATRAADGANETTTVGVSISPTAGTAVSVTGPTTVAPGATGTFTAHASNVTMYRWSSVMGYGTGSASSSTFTVSPPAGSSGTDTVALTVYFTDGTHASYTVDYSIGGGLTVTLTGPGSMLAGSSAQYVLTVNQATSSIRWNVNDARCSLVPGAGAKSATLTCPSSFTGQVVVSTTVTDATGATAHNAVGVNVSKTALSTTLSLTASAGYPTTFQGVLADSTGHAVAGVPVRLETRAGTTGAWSLAKTLTTDTFGVAKTQYAVKRAAYYRLRFTGNSSRKGSASAARRVKVLTHSAGSKTSTSFVEKLTTGWGSAVTSAPVTLQHQVNGSWKAYRSYKTNSHGQVSIAFKGLSRGYWRYTYAGSSNYSGSRSATLKR